MKVSYTTRAKVLSTALKLWVSGKAGSRNNFPRLETRLMGLALENPVGLAPGIDLTGNLIAGARNAGFGFTEVGTVTPLNLAKTQQNMGRHNDGYSGYVIGVNVGCKPGAVGKNAIAQQMAALRGCLPLFDFATVNLSSPHTRTAREEGMGWIETLLSASAVERDLHQGKTGGRVPLALKVSAIEYEPARLNEILTLSLKLGFDGAIVVCPPDNALPTLKDARETIKRHNGDMDIISIGGILNREHVQVRLDAGAVAVQVFSSVLDKGLSLPQSLLTEGA